MIKNLSLSFLFFCALNIQSQTNIQPLGHLTYPNGVTCSNLTGYVDTAGNEYALVGTSQGLSIVALRVPTNPTQLFLVPGATGQGGFWREVREHNGFAYVTTEQSSGLVVVDLRWLPDSIGYHTIRPSNMRTSHTIFIDENGIAYLNGTDIGNGGSIFLNLNANPWNPPVLGSFDNNYVHDCYVRNDTMWAALINDGILKVVDVRNKQTTNQSVNTLATQSTPLNFSHNCWLSDDSKYLFTTDEKPSSFLTCYDVSDLNNITETDRTQVNPGSNTIIHNTHYMNDYCISSYYTYGITIHDVKRKNNLVEVGHFDTSPNFSGDGFNGAWGVWPYLPSGHIIVSDIETGLWVLNPTYQRASYLEGVVKDSVCNVFLNGVTVEILNTNSIDNTNFIGKYSMGATQSGLFTVRVSKNGYASKVFNNISLNNDSLTILNVSLNPIATSNFTATTTDVNSGSAIPFVKIQVRDTLGVLVDEFTSDASGLFNQCNFVYGTYDIYVGKWGRVTNKTRTTINSLTTNIILPTRSGYYDDFVMNYGWVTTSNATSGQWVRGLPNGTDFNGVPSNPGVDIASDFGKECYVTGNAGGEAGEDDIDGGVVLLTSPLMDFSNYTDPYISFYRWFYNGGGQGTTANDSLTVTISNGIDRVIIDTLIGVSSEMSRWVFKNFRVLDFISLTSNMQIEFRASDVNPGHIVEAAVDVFMVVDSGLSSIKQTMSGSHQVKIFPSPTNDFCTIYIDGEPAAKREVRVFSMLGELIQNSTFVGNCFKMNRLPSEGIYTVVLVDADGKISEHKIVRTN
jgi:choice-of-anchor B domain-containing protein